MAGDCGAGENLEHGLLRLRPDRMRGAGFREQDRPGMRQTLRQIAPSMASIDFEHGGARPRGEMRKPPDWPRREEMSPARVRACRTLERKLSGAPVAWASSGSETRRASAEGGQLNHHADGVIGGARELHRRIGFLHGILPNDPSTAQTAASRRRCAIAGASVGANASQADVFAITDPGRRERIAYFFQFKLERNSPKCAAPCRTLLPLHLAGKNAVCAVQARAAAVRSVLSAPSWRVKGIFRSP